MNAETLLARVRSARAEWDSVLTGVDADRMEEPGVVGRWSARDVIAHITWFEREMIGVIRARALAGSDLWELGHAERNEAIFVENRDRPLDEVRTEAASAFAELTEALGTLTDRDLEDAGRFAGMPAEWTPLEIIAQNTYEHYEAHARSVRDWLERG